MAKGLGQRGPVQWNCLGNCSTTGCRNSLGPLAPQDLSQILYESVINIDRFLQLLHKEKVNHVEKENPTIILDFSCFQVISKKTNQSIFWLVCSKMLVLTSLATCAGPYRNGSLLFCTLPKHLDVRSWIPCGKWPRKILNNIIIASLIVCS